MAEKYKGMSGHSIGRRSQRYESPDHFENNRLANHHNNNKINDSALNDDDDDDDDFVVDEDDEELEKDEDEEIEDEDCRLLQQADANLDNVQLRLMRGTASSDGDDSDDLVAQMLANMAARFKNFEDILADLRLQVGEMASRDEEIIRRMALLNEEISEMHLLDALSTSGAIGGQSGLHNLSSVSSIVPSKNNNETDAYGDLHMTDYASETHLSSHLTSAKTNSGKTYIK